MRHHHLGDHYQSTTTLSDHVVGVANSILNGVGFSYLVWPLKEEGISSGGSTYK